MEGFVGLNEVQGTRVGLRRAKILCKDEVRVSLAALSGDLWFASPAPLRTVAQG
jgi:hypothetical protein